MRNLMREIINKIDTFLVKTEDPDFVAWRGAPSIVASAWSGCVATLADGGW